MAALGDDHLIWNRLLYKEKPSLRQLIFTIQEAIRTPPLSEEKRVRAMDDLDALEFNLDKLELICVANARDMETYEDLAQNLSNLHAETEVAEAREDAESLSKQLSETQRRQLNKTTYEKVASEINKLSSQESLQRELAGVREETRREKESISQMEAAISGKQHALDALLQLLQQIVHTDDDSSATDRQSNPCCLPIMGFMDDLKKQARETEAETEGALNQLNELAQTLEAEGLEVGDGQTQPEEKLYVLITRHLENLKNISQEMQTVATLKLEQAQVTRLTEVHQTLSREFAKVRSTISAKREKHQLFGKAQPKSDEEATTLLLRENRSLDSSLELTKNIIAQADGVKGSLYEQKTRLQGTSEKVVRFAETLPGINILLSRISRRHKLNALVIGLALAICLCITFIYLF